MRNSIAEPLNHRRAAKGNSTDLVKPVTRRGIPKTGGIPQRDVVKLVKAHKGLEDPMSAAIWIKHDQPEVWLVEVIPSLSDEARAEEPIRFNPGITFRFPLALIAGNAKCLKQAIKRNRTFARELSKGTPIYETPTAHELINLAKRAHNKS